MVTLAPCGRDLFLRYEGPAGSWVECHRLWGDSTYFFNLRHASFAAMDPPTKVTLSDEAAYRAHKGYKS